MWSGRPTHSRKALLFFWTEYFVWCWQKTIKHRQACECGSFARTFRSDGRYTKTVHIRLALGKWTFEHFLNDERQSWMDHGWIWYLFNARGIDLRHSSFRASCLRAFVHPKWTHQNWWNEFLKNYPKKNSVNSTIMKKLNVSFSCLHQ